MKPAEIVARLRGFTLLGVGASFAPAEADSARARRVLSFLADRRVLYVPSEMEVPTECVDSVLRIREVLTQELAGDPGPELAAALRAMRASCRRFLDTVSDGPRRSIIRHANVGGHHANWTFGQALGEMRGVFGVQVGLLAVRFQVDIEDDLSRILPQPDEAGS